MPRSVRTYLDDVLRSCDEIIDLVHGKTFEEFSVDRVLRPAIERHLGIVGEALYCAGKQEPSVKDAITGFPMIVALRHRLIHGYFSTSLEIVWRAVSDGVPRLRTEVGSLLEDGR